MNFHNTQRSIPVDWLLCQ